MHAYHVFFIPRFGPSRTLPLCCLLPPPRLQPPPPPPLSLNPVSATARYIHLWFIYLCMTQQKEFPYLGTFARFFMFFSRRVDKLARTCTTIHVYCCDNICGVFTCTFELTVNAQQVSTSHGQRLMFSFLISFAEGAPPMLATRILAIPLLNTYWAGLFFISTTD